jgi:hypothetical protein
LVPEPVGVAESKVVFGSNPPPSRAEHSPSVERYPRNIDRVGISLDQDRKVIR